MSGYGDMPVKINTAAVNCVEMMFYHDMPIKFPEEAALVMEPRLRPFEGIVGMACCDFIGIRGLNEYMDSYVYICAKRLYQEPGHPFNRPGWHTDGFGTKDINYVWSDGVPTIFSATRMSLPEDDSLSMVEMERQAKPEDNRTFASGTVLRLDPYVVHRVGDILDSGIRTFCKVTFSKDKFNLSGNAKNYLLAYEWDPRGRSLARNTPQAL